MPAIKPSTRSEVLSVGSSLLLIVIFGGALAGRSFGQSIPICPGAPRWEESPFPGFTRLADMILPFAAVNAPGVWTPTPWPGGVIPYEFDSAVTPPTRLHVERAMAEIEALGAVDFVPRGPGHSLYLLIQALSPRSFIVAHQPEMGHQGWRASVGAPTGTMPYAVLGLPSDAEYADVGYNTVHSLMHVLGFIDEEARQDRDSYVTVFLENVNPLDGRVSTIQVTLPENGPSTSCYVPVFPRPLNIVNTTAPTSAYDFLSIMHGAQYDWDMHLYWDWEYWTGPYNYDTTILCHPLYAQYQASMGHRAYLTHADAQDIAALYGPPSPPAITGATPAFAIMGAGPQTITLAGARFLRGSTVSYAVQGTRAYFNGSLVEATSLEGDTLQLVLPEAILTTPGLAHLTVENPAPGGGLSNALPIVVQCPLPVAMTAAVPLAVSGVCQGFDVSPSPGDWNVVGMGSSSNWDVSLGGVTSASGGSTLDYVVANGSAGTIIGAGGVFTRSSGSTGGVALHRAAATMTPGSSFDSSLTAGHPFRPVQFNVTSSGTFDIQLAGDGSLFWRLYAPGSDGSWRPRADSIASGSPNGGGVTASLGTGLHAIVVFKNASVAATNLSFTLHVCPDLPTLTLPSGNTILSAGCQPFSMIANAGNWNVVSIGSPSNWDIAIGSAESEFSGPTVDYLIANGHLGSVAPTTGIINRESGADTAVASVPPLGVLTPNGSAAPATWSSGNQVALFEFQVTTARCYDFRLANVLGTGIDDLRWQLFATGADAAWRPRSGADADGSVDGQVVVAYLSVGWHALVVTRDVSASVFGSYSITIGPTASGPPTLVSLAPASMLVGSPAQTLTVHGLDFTCTALVFCNLTPLATVFVDSTEVRATVPDNLLASTVNWNIFVQNLGPGGGSSGNPLPLAVVNATPILSSITPSSVDAGQAGFSLTCQGSGLHGSSRVRWNGAYLPTLSITSQQITATVTAAQVASAGSATITVWTPGPGGGESAPRTLTITNAAPTLTWLEPSDLPVGAYPAGIMIFGTGFSPATTILIGGSTYTPTFGSATTLSLPLPASLTATAALLGLRARNPMPGGGVSAGLGLEIRSPLPVTVGASPATVTAGSPGLTLNVYGGGFVLGAVTSDSVVRWNGVSLPTTPSSPLPGPRWLVAQVPASLLQTAGPAAITVFNPAPGGGTSNAQTVTVLNPAPSLLALSASSVVAGSSATSITLLGSGFNAQSAVVWDGATTLSSSALGSTQIQTTIPASLLASAGAHSLRVSNPLPGGGLSGARSFTVENPVPTAANLSPSTSIAGGPGATVVVTGANFVPTSVVQWNGSPRATTFISAGEIRGTVTAADLGTAGAAMVTAVNPTPGGGTSSPLSFSVAAPVITSVLPGLIPIQAPMAAAVAVTINGSRFLPGTSRVSANGAMLMPTASSGSQLVVQVSPALVLQSTRAGAIAFTVENAPNGVSNTVPLLVGGGSNAGTIRRHPLAPIPGQAYSAIIEGGYPSGVFTLAIDLLNPPPVAAWPTPQVDLVLAVTSSGSIIPLVDGFGLFSQATGATLDANGNFALPGFALPNPPYGFALTAQAVYLDPTSPLGFRLTWARFPDYL